MYQPIKPILFLIGMASLYTSVFLAVMTMIIIRRDDYGWLKKAHRSWPIIITLLAIWCFALAASLPPAVGLGHYSQDMIGVR